MTTQEMILESMKEMALKFSLGGQSLEMPPQSSQTIGTVFVDVEVGKMLSAEFKYDRKFANPTGMFQGGFLCACFDEVYGPLSYMAAQRPVVTLDMNTTFIRPFGPNDQTATLTAKVVSLTRTLLVMSAECKTAKGQLLATSTNTSLILSDEQLRVLQLAAGSKTRVP